MVMKDYATATSEASVIIQFGASSLGWAKSFTFAKAFFMQVKAHMASADHCNCFTEFDLAVRRSLRGRRICIQ